MFKKTDKWLNSIRTEEERKRRSIRISKINSKNFNKTCKNCEKVFCATKNTKYCSADCARSIYYKNLCDFDIKRYDEIVSKQHGICPICLKKKKGKLVVDHCHKELRFRGLICRVCNTSLRFVEDAELFERVQKHLRYENA